MLSLSPGKHNVKNKRWRINYVWVQQSWHNYTDEHPSPAVKYNIPLLRIAVSLYIHRCQVVFSPRVFEYECISYLLSSSINNRISDVIHRSRWLQCNWHSRFTIHGCAQCVSIFKIQFNPLLGKLNLQYKNSSWTAGIHFCSICTTSRGSCCW